MGRRIIDLDQIDFQNGDNKQGALDAFTDVSSASNEHVLTKDTATGHAIFKINPALITSSSIYAKGATNQNIVGNIYTKVLFGSESKDILEEFSNSTFTSKSSQTVMVSCSVSMVSLSGDRILYLYVYLNGSAFLTFSNNSSWANLVSVSVGFPVDVNIGDTIDIYVRHTDGSNTKQLNGNQLLYITKI
jgi:hypothetical protein